MREGVRFLIDFCENPSIHRPVLHERFLWRLIVIWQRSIFLLFSKKLAGFLKIEDRPPYNRFCECLFWMLQ